MLMIDALRNDTDIVKFGNDNKIEFEYVNILAYCKETYQITVTDLGKLLKVERQTIYNYFKLTSAELSFAVINKLQNIYKINSLDQIFIFEKNNIIMPNENSYNAEKQETVKKSFADSIRFEALFEKISLDHSLLLKLEALLKKHSRDYLIEVLDNINVQDKNSFAFLSYLEDYKSIDNTEYHHFRIIDKIINSNGMIKLDISDFKPIKKIYQIYSVKFDELKDIYIDSGLSNKIIVNVCSGPSMTLDFLKDILDVIRSKFGDDIVLIYGHTFDKNILEPRIDIITYVL